MHVKPASNEPHAAVPALQAKMLQNVAETAAQEGIVTAAELHKSDIQALAKPRVSLTAADAQVRP